MGYEGEEEEDKKKREEYSTSNIVYTIINGLVSKIVSSHGD